MDKVLQDKLVPGDRVMKIPASHGGQVYEQTVPYGACGVVLEGEGYFDARCIHTWEKRKGYGCLVKFDHHDSGHGSGRWFVDRKNLLKITPDENLLNDQDARNLNFLEETLDHFAKANIRVSGSTDS